MMATWLEGGQMSMPLVPSGIFRTGEGWLQLSILREPQFPILCEVLGMTGAGSDPRFANNAGRVAHQAEIEAMLERALAAHGASAWCEKLAAAGIMHERVNSYTDFLSEPIGRAHVGTPVTNAHPVCR